MEISLSKEMIRKLFHCIILIAIFPVILFEKSTLIILFTALLLFLLILEFMRVKKFKFSIWIFEKFFVSIMRSRELNDSFTLKSIDQMAIAMLILCIFFSKFVIIISIVILAICDSLSALIGKFFGKIKVYKNKTLEGSAAFFVSSTSILYFFLTLTNKQNFLKIVATSLILTFLELFDAYRNYYLDDNLIISISCAVLVSHFLI